MSTIKYLRLIKKTKIRGLKIEFFFKAISDTVIRDALAFTWAQFSPSPAYLTN